MIGNLNQNKFRDYVNKTLSGIIELKPAVKIEDKIFYGTPESFTGTPAWDLFISPDARYGNELFAWAHDKDVYEKTTDIYEIALAYNATVAQEVHLLDTYYSFAKKEPSPSSEYSVKTGNKEVLIEPQKEEMSS